MSTSKPGEKSKRSKLAKKIENLESRVRKSKVELYKLAIDSKIKKRHKPGETIVCFLEYGQLSSATCEALTKIYSKEGWKVSFPMDSRGDGGYIELSK